MGSSAPTVVPAYAGLAEIDVEGDGVTGFEVIEVRRRFQGFLRVRPGTHAQEGLAQDQ